MPATGAPRRRRRWRAAEGGGGGYVAYGIAAIALLILGFIVWIEVTPRIQRCDGLVAGSVRYTQQDCQSAANVTHLLATAFGWWLIGGVVAGVWCGLRDGRRRRRLACGQTAFAVVIAVVAVWTFAAYATGYLIGRRLPGKARPLPLVTRTFPSPPVGVQPLRG